jgi:hypothetical protein
MNVIRAMSSALSWCLPLRVLTIAGDEVHVWRASLELPTWKAEI